MFLYDKNGSEIEVFEMKPNMQKVVEYKKTQIANEGKVLEAVSNDKRVLDTWDDRILLSEVEYEKINSFDKKVYHHLKEVEPSIETQTLLADYCVNGNKRHELKRIVDYRKNSKEFVDLRYLLLTDYYKSLCRRCHRMKNIIELNKQLFILYLLEQEQIHKLTYEDVSEQLDLFNIKYVKDISMADIKRNINDKSVASWLEQITQNREITSKILTKVK